MAFIELTPKKTTSDENSKSKVRIRFYPKKKGRYNLMIRIGRELANKIDIKPGDKISFSYDDENKRSWLIKKTNNPGYKVSGRPAAPTFTVQLTWNPLILFEPEGNELRMRYVASDIYQGGIKIDARIPE
jgi:hypothetical protein